VQTTGRGRNKGIRKRYIQRSVWAKRSEARNGRNSYLLPIDLRLSSVCLVSEACQPPGTAPHPPPAPPLALPPAPTCPPPGPGWEGVWISMRISGCHHLMPLLVPTHSRYTVAAHPPPPQVCIYDHGLTVDKDTWVHPSP
jgi:hypothetical protein